MQILQYSVSGESKNQHISKAWFPGGESEYSGFYHDLKVGIGHTSRLLLPYSQCSHFTSTTPPANIRFDLDSGIYSSFQKRKVVAVFCDGPVIRFLDWCFDFSLFSSITVRGDNCVLIMWRFIICMGWQGWSTYERGMASLIRDG